MCSNSYLLFIRDTYDTACAAYAAFAMRNKRCRMRCARRMCCAYLPEIMKNSFTFAVRSAHAVRAPRGGHSERKQRAQRKQRAHRREIAIRQRHAWRAVRTMNATRATHAACSEHAAWKMHAVRASRSALSHAAMDKH